jgi:hypothetical protein
MGKAKNGKNVSNPDENVSNGNDGDAAGDMFSSHSDWGQSIHKS